MPYSLVLGDISMDRRLEGKVAIITDAGMEIKSYLNTLKKHFLTLSPLQKVPLSPYSQYCSDKTRSPQPPLKRGTKNGFISPFLRGIMGDL
jgi:hypothetical protein